MYKPTPEIEAILRGPVKRAILDAPHAFIMGRFIANSWDDAFREIREPEKNVCGTAACLAGTMVAIVDQIDLLQLPGVTLFRCPNGTPLVEGNRIARRAREITGVAHLTEVGLFFRDQWPIDLMHDYGAATTDTERVQVAARAIDRYLADPGEFTEDDEDDEDYD